MYCGRNKEPVILYLLRGVEDILGVGNKENPLGGWGYQYLSKRLPKFTGGDRERAKLNVSIRKFRSGMFYY